MSRGSDLTLLDFTWIIASGYSFRTYFLSLLLWFHDLKLPNNLTYNFIICVMHFYSIIRLIDVKITKRVSQRGSVAVATLFFTIRRAWRLLSLSEHVFDQYPRSYFFSLPVPTPLLCNPKKMKIRYFWQLWTSWRQHWGDKVIFVYERAPAYRRSFLLIFPHADKKCKIATKGRGFSIIKHIHLYLNTIYVI